MFTIVAFQVDLAHVAEGIATGSAPASGTPLGPLVPAEVTTTCMLMTKSVFNRGHSDTFRKNRSL